MPNVLVCFRISTGSILPNIEISGMTFNQSVEFPLTQRNSCTLSGQLHTHNGTGTGGMNLGWRHLFSHKSWSEVEIVAGNVNLKRKREV